MRVRLGNWSTLEIFSQAMFDDRNAANRDLSRDDWIKERKSSGLVWAVGAAEKKNLPTAISMQLFVVFF